MRGKCVSGISVWARLQNRLALRNMTQPAQFSVYMQQSDETINVASIN